MSLKDGQADSPTKVQQLTGSKKEPYEPKSNTYGYFMGEQEQKYMPIKALNQFSQVSIKARVVKKGFRAYSNARGSGHLINLDLMDREGTMIQATGFGQQAINFDDHIQ